LKQQLRKPEYWRDFEDLCKILWGEIWNCPEIKKNGRMGQEQHGVDVYGVPSWEKSEYYGIQCKGKDEYTHAQLTKTEIDKEIEKAKLFKPSLKKFYFATTANKDTVIEEYIRTKDVESRNNDCFEIHLFNWEDIVSLIDQNKKTHDWYVKKLNFSTNHSVLVTLHNGLDIIDFSPILLRNNVTYKVKPIDNDDFISGYYRTPDEIRETQSEILYEPQPVRYFFNCKTFNKSACVFSLRIINTGNNALENYKLHFELKSENIKADTVNKNKGFMNMFPHKYNTFFYKDSLDGVFEPESSILVQKDSIITDEICIRPTIENPQTVDLKWHLVAKDFDEKGVIKLNLHTEVINESTVEEYEYPFEDEIRLENYTVYDDE